MRERCFFHCRRFEMFVHERPVMFQHVNPVFAPVAMLSPPIEWRRVKLAELNHALHWTPTALKWLQQSLVRTYRYNERFTNRFSLLNPTVNRRPCSSRVWVRSFSSSGRLRSISRFSNRSAGRSNCRVYWRNHHWRRSGSTWSTLRQTLVLVSLQSRHAALHRCATVWQQTPVRMIQHSHRCAWSPSVFFRFANHSSKCNCVPKIKLVNGKAFFALLGGSFDMHDSRWLSNRYLRQRSDLSRRWAVLRVHVRCSSTATVREQRTHRWSRTGELGDSGTLWRELHARSTFVRLTQEICSFFSSTFQIGIIYFAVVVVVLLLLCVLNLMK